MESDRDSWVVWSNHVLNELKRLNEAQESLNKDIKNISIDIATLKVKAGVWGVLGGLVPAAIVIIMNYAKK